MGYLLGGSGVSWLSLLLVLLVAIIVAVVLLAVVAAAVAVVIVLVVKNKKKKEALADAVSEAADIAEKNSGIIQKSRGSKAPR